MARPLSPHDGRRVSRTARPAEARAAVAAFTLLELLAVVAIIALLAGLVFGAAQGVRERSRRAQAAAELAVLAQALEAFRGVHGEYPITGAAANIPLGPAAAEDGPGILFNALTGRRGPGGPLARGGRSFVSLGAHVLQVETLAPSGAATPAANAFVDPWGRRYLYFYRTGAGWKRRAPLLLSAGPDGAVALTDEVAEWDGALAPGGANADNVVAGE